VRGPNAHATRSAAKVTKGEGALGANSYMGFSSRIFLLDDRDALYRLANSAFAKMLRDPDAHRLAFFAGQRVRMADAIVQLVNRRPIAVVRLTFGILAFDQEGRFDSQGFQ
jgi:hypothetical protein